jgi:ankyrin repeat protein
MPGDPPLYRAALNGDVEQIDRLIADGDDPNVAIEGTRWTPLMAAVDSRSPDAVAAVLRAPGVDVNRADDLGETALHAAVRTGEGGLVAALIADRRVDPNARSAIGRTPLSLAAFDGDRRVVAVLLNDPVSRPNLVDRDRQTPLHWAVMGGHAAVVQALLDDPRTNPGIRNTAGLTALDIAREGTDPAVAAPLQAAGERGSDELDPGDMVPTIEVELPLPRRIAIPEPPRPGSS